MIKDIRNLFRLKKELNYTAIKDIRNIFRLEKETKPIKNRILRDIKNLLNMKAMVVEKKHYQLKNILIELVHI